jgi:gluconate kinase
MKVPDKRGGKCRCGEFVRFDVTKHRLEHFMVCPVVDRRLKKLEQVKVDEDAVARGMAAAGAVA